MFCKGTAICDYQCLIVIKRTMLLQIASTRFTVFVVLSLVSRSVDGENGSSSSSIEESLVWSSRNCTSGCPSSSFTSTTARSAPPGGSSVSSLASSAPAVVNTWARHSRNRDAALPMMPAAEFSTRGYSRPAAPSTPAFGGGPSDAKRLSVGLLLPHTTFKVREYGKAVQMAVMGLRKHELSFLSAYRFQLADIHTDMLKVNPSPTGIQPSLLQSFMPLRVEASVQVLAVASFYARMSAPIRSQFTCWLVRSRIAAGSRLYISY